MQKSLPVGKLPPDLLARLISSAPAADERLLVGPGIGLDCAILDAGSNLLALKSEPITFATEEIGWYAVQIAANDVATTGAQPRWLLVTVLLPEGKTTPELVEKIGSQLFEAARQLGVAVIGGHTEITHGLDRPILNTTLIGEVSRDKLVTPQGAEPGDRILLTKGAPIEATAILARELPERLSSVLSPEELQEAQRFLYEPGISVVMDAQIALSAGKVNAMHDPTEGGVVNALWELAQASGTTLRVEPANIPIPELSARICAHLGIDPLCAIASGALLLTAAPAEADLICSALNAAGIHCQDIGVVESGPARIMSGEQELIPPERDAIARFFEESEQAG